MFTWFAIGAVLVFVLLYWLFFVRPAQVKNKVRALARSTQTQRPYAVHTQSLVVEQDVHLTGRSYGHLLREAQGDRQKVEFWIVEAQRQMPDYSRTQVIEALAERCREAQVSLA